MATDTATGPRDAEVLTLAADAPLPVTVDGRDLGPIPVADLLP